jgi:hypothetical protein
MLIFIIIMDLGHLLNCSGLTHVNFPVHIIWDHANDANILGRSVHNIKKNTEALVIASKETGLEVNAVKTKYMVISRDQNAGRSHSIETDNNSFKRVEVLCGASPP